MPSQNFNVVGLDFIETKESLKSFLRSQDTLRDYNFDGSVINTLLDVLAYNTQYQSFYANMVANEMFLDTAVLRPSVVSHAKNLGYVPTSRRSSSATINVLVNGIVGEGTYLSRGTEFNGVDGSGKQYGFILLDTVHADVQTNSFKNVKIHEGILRRVSYVYNPSIKTSSYLLIPNDKIDTNTIRVRVKASPTDSQGISDNWTYANSYIDLTPQSKVFFLQEKEAGMYELFFGDNFLGKQPDTGSLVTIEYLETNADDANGIERFTHSISNLGTVSTVSLSSGGALEESVSQMKFLAPRYFQTQQRAVTENDYSAIVTKEYPNAVSVYVYGGETVTPPQYGKVFIAIKPKSGVFLTQDIKSSLVNTIKKNRSVVTVIPEIVDPDYIDVVVDSLVTFDPSNTSFGEGTLRALVLAYVYSFSLSSLESFGSNFYLSKMTQGIDALDNSILGNQTKITLRKTISLNRLAASKGISIDFKNPIYHPHDGHTSVITTSKVSHVDTEGNVVTDVYAEDDGNGNINLVKTVQDKTTIVYPNIGTIDYSKGKIDFASVFSPTSRDISFIVTVKPENTDIFVSENKILRVSRAYSDSVTVRLQTQVNRKQNLK